MPIPSSALAAHISGTTVKFVASISASPTVRLDINDGDGYRVKDQGANFDPPAMRRAIAETILRDGGYISATALENRTITLPIIVQGSTVDDAAAKLRTLIGELNREQNILQIQWGSTPLYFRTFRSLDFQVDVTDAALCRFTVTCPILAEPYAYGLRVDQASVSVKADPAVVNGCYLDVNGVTGDVETPAYVAFSAGTGAGSSPSWLAVRRHGTPSSFPFVYQAESAASLGADTTVAGSPDATASGAGNNYLTTTFATDATLVSRLIVNVAASNQVETRGTYRVLVRVKKSGGSDTITMAPVSAARSVSTVGAGTGWQIVDLGLVQFPFGEDTPDGFSGVYPNLYNGLQLNILAARTSGAGTLKIDYVLLVPADENMVTFTPGLAWTATTYVLDGPNDAAYVRVSGAVATSLLGAARGGSIPLLRPGNNRLFLVENTTTAAVTDSSTVAVSFWPRFMVV